MSMPLARATTGLESSARSGAAAAHNSVVMVSAHETMRRVEAMKRNPLAKGANRRVIFKRSDLGANRSGLVVFKSIGPRLKAPNFGADTRAKRLSLAMAESRGRLTSA